MNLGQAYMRLIRPWRPWNTNVMAWLTPQNVVGGARMGAGGMLGFALLGMFAVFVVWTTEYGLYLYWVLFVSAVFAYLVPIVALVRYLKRRHMARIIARVTAGSCKRGTCSHVRSIA